MSHPETHTTTQGMLRFSAMVLLSCLIASTAIAQIGANAEPNNARLADRFPSIQAAIDDLPTSGGTVLLSANKTYPVVCGSTQINSGRKIIHIIGHGRSSVISGSGCKLITLSASGSTVEDLTVQDKQGSPATVAIFLANGLAGMTDWVLKDLNLLGTGKKGIGVGTDFALIGKIRGGEISGWDRGVQFTGPELSHRSNANQISGVNIHVNNIGVDVPTGADDNFIESSTIEGNSIGIKMGAVKAFAKISITDTHFENNQGPTPTNIELDGVAGAVISSGNGFYAGYTGRDIYVASGTWYVISNGDTLNEGVTNGGTGYVNLRCPLALKVLTGTGPILNECIQGPTGTNLDHQAYSIAGFSQVNALDLEVSNNFGVMLNHRKAASPLTNYALAQTSNGNTTVNGSTLTLSTGNKPAASMDDKQGFSIAKKLFVPRCASGSSPAACGQSISGSVALPAGSAELVVNTNSVTSESQILITEDASLKSVLNLPCDPRPGRSYIVIDRFPGKSFTVHASAPSTSGPACLSFAVIN